MGVVDKARCDSAKQELVIGRRWKRVRGEQERKAPLIADRIGGGIGVVGVICVSESS